MICLFSVTQVDFTSCAGFFAVLGIVVFITGIVTAIVLAFKYLVIGNRKHTISPEEYVYGALKIYTDIIYIFLNLLQIVGSRT
ncbi:hypothetical protein GDO86_018460 [Hymenochirus boettgeri]|uniref:Uncharacterized protein n=1 Tax=Hymenochirus boettgeri TaxID=247094 RepID=A0A8T2IDN3_9PIPI|nr:hypothetical protein GDO86_018460 [Hymenochirus boettgeri]